MRSHNDTTTIVCFNPFMPKAGVGRVFIIFDTAFTLFVSIHLCPKQALEADDIAPATASNRRFQSIYAQSRRWKIFCFYCPLLNISGFNPFMPKAGVGSSTKFGWKCGCWKFQSIYAQSRRWKCQCIILLMAKNQVSIHLCPKQALEA